MDGFQGVTEGLDAPHKQRMMYITLLSKIGILSIAAFEKQDGLTKSVLSDASSEVNHQSELREKYTDCLGSIINVGIEFGYTDIDIDREELIDYDLAQTFINIYLDVNELLIVASRDSYEELFKDFMTLARLLKLSRKEILEEFVKKYEKVTGKKFEDLDIDN